MNYSIQHDPMPAICEAINRIPLRACCEQPRRSLYHWPDPTGGHLDDIELTCATCGTSAWVAGGGRWGLDPERDARTLAASWNAGRAA